MKPPCSPETQDDAESLITVNDFDIPALREDAENSEEKKSESHAQNQDGQNFMETVLVPVPRDGEARLPDDRAPFGLPSPSAAANGRRNRNSGKPTPSVPVRDGE